SLIRVADIEHFFEASVRKDFVRIFVMRLVLAGLSADAARRRNLGHSAQHFPSLGENRILVGAVILAAAERVEYAAGIDVESCKFRIQHARTDLRTSCLPQVEAHESGEGVGVSPFRIELRRDQAAEGWNFSEDRGVQRTARLRMVLSREVNQRILV